MSDRKASLKLRQGLVEQSDDIRFWIRLRRTHRGHDCTQDCAHHYSQTKIIGLAPCTLGHNLSERAQRSSQLCGPERVRNGEPEVDALVLVHPLLCSQ